MKTVLFCGGHGTRIRDYARRRTALDARTLQHLGYAINQRCRRWIEEVFGWIKGVAGLAQVKVVHGRV